MKVKTCCDQVTYLEDSITRELTERALRNQPVAVVLDGNLPLYRLADHATTSASPEIVLSELVPEPTPRWSRIGDLLSVFSRPVEEFAAVCDIQRWGPPTLPFATARACGAASELLKGLGSEHADLIDIEKWPPTFEAIFSRCLADQAEATQLPKTFGRRILEALWTRVAQTDVRPYMVCLHKKRASVFVEWRAADGRVILGEKLQEFVESIVHVAAQELVDSIVRLRVARPDHEKVGMTILSALSPTVAEAVSHACRADPCTGLRLCTAPSRHGSPMDIWLFCDPHHAEGNVGACTLSVHRQHQEFVLRSAPSDESPEGGFFYFPPILLVARVVFSTPAVPRAELPMVRQPTNGYVWTHPYTEALTKSDPFNDAVIRGSRGDPAMAKPSKTALRTFPELSERVSEARERDLCLAGQTETLNALYKALRTDLACGVDLQTIWVDYVSSIHDIARLGLTHAHQNNKATPRVQLNVEKMPYIVRQSSLMRALAKRLFPYNPRRPILPSRLPATYLNWLRKQVSGARGA